MPWMLLEPRELEQIMRPVSGDGEHADLLRLIQGKVDPKYKELRISGAEAIRVRSAANNWQLGHERAFQALVAAMDRHV